MIYAPIFRKQILIQEKRYERLCEHSQAAIEKAEKGSQPSDYFKNDVHDVDRDVQITHGMHPDFYSNPLAEKRLKDMEPKEDTRKSYEIELKSLESEYNDAIENALRPGLNGEAIAMRMGEKMRAVELEQQIRDLKKKIASLDDRRMKDTNEVIMEEDRTLARMRGEQAPFTDGASEENEIDSEAARGMFLGGE
mmetsp:Transcript_7781/g.11754  ORF Transcript_7781/g.11754 Transcript_7781/m.11754 type:complete len:194 (-) Transcript_7781:39-620(-)